MPLNMTEEQVAEHCRRNNLRNPLASAVAPPRDASAGSSEPTKRNKYGAVKTRRDGITFDSKREADRWSELVNMQLAGEIRGVARQVGFRLPGGIWYKADFVVLQMDGTYRVEDAKGVRTKEYMLKKRLMRECLKIEIVEV